MHILCICVYRSFIIYIHVSVEVLLFTYEYIFFLYRYMNVYLDMKTLQIWKLYIHVSVEEKKNESLCKCVSIVCYGVALVSRIDQIIGLFCKRAEPYNRDNILPKRPMI